MKKIICLLCSVGIFALCFTGCSSKESKAEKVVTEFLTGYQEKNADIINYLEYSVDSSGISFNGFQGLLAEQMEFTVESIDQDGEQITVGLTIENIDLKQEFNNVIESVSEDATQEEILSKLEDALSKDNCAKRKFECEVIVTDSDEPKIIMTDLLSNALLGGYNEYLSELTNS